MEPPHPGPEDRSIQACFERWLANHEHVYDMIVDMARQARDAGHTQVGIKMLWEVARWNLFLADDGSGDYKLNNNYPSRLVRVIEQRDPDLAGMFRKRELKAS